MYINRSEYLFYDLLKMPDTHLCHATKIKMFHNILLSFLRKIEQNRRLLNYLSFYRQWICLCWQIFHLKDSEYFHQGVIQKVCLLKIDPPPSPPCSFLFISHIPPHPPATAIANVIADLNQTAN